MNLEQWLALGAEILFTFGIVMWIRDLIQLHVNRTRGQ